MIGDFLLEYFLFPLAVLFAGLMYLVLDAWMQIVVLMLIVAIIYLIAKGAR